jgi:hypothetical protein
VLDHDEERRLAEIEEHLLRESPDLDEIFGQPAIDPEPPPAPGPTRPGLLSALVRSFALLAAAIALTTIVTLTLGPDAGGFVAVITFCVVGMYGYQTIRGCPGMRRARGQG